MKKILLSSFILSAICCLAGCTQGFFHNTALIKGDDSYYSRISYSLGGTPWSVTRILETERQKFDDPDYGNVYAPRYNLSPEIYATAAYYSEKEKAYGRRTIYGMTLSDRFYFRDNGVNTNGKSTLTGWYEDPWDRRYYAALEPHFTVEPFWGKGFYNENVGFVHLTVGLPITYFAWEKYYYLQADQTYYNWSKQVVEEEKKFMPGISGRITFGFAWFYDDVGISCHARYAPVKMGGGWMNSFTGYLGIYADCDWEHFFER